MRIIFALILILFISTPSFGTIILSDNFDNCTSGCNVGGTEPNSPSTGSWTQWHTDNISGTYGGVTHYSGEITSTGRGGTGKSLKLWRAESNFIGSASYSGSLLYTTSTARSDFYFRFYAKIPAALSIPDDTKAWRLNCSGGSGEIYFAFMGGGSSPYFVVSADGGGGYHTETLATVEQLAALRDGDWHCWQFRFNIGTGTITMWADGVQLSSVTHSNYAQTAWNSYLQHWPLGNSQGGNWQLSWQSFEVDDVIIATTKAETDPDGGSDTTAPTVSITTSDPSSITSDSLSVTGTASDAVWGDGSVCKWRIGSAPDASNGTPCTGTTSWTCATSGYSRGSNTLYVGCGDAVPNWGAGDSIVVNFPPTMPGLNAVTGLSIGK